MHSELIIILHSYHKMEFISDTKCPRNSIYWQSIYIAKSGRPGPSSIDITNKCPVAVVNYKGYRPCINVRSYGTNHESENHIKELPL